MAERQILFDDGAAYERMMGIWSREVGRKFIDWVAPEPGQRWIDVGCGNGAFTALLVDRCTPSEIHGVDPAAGQLDYARTRLSGSVAEFHEGTADSLPFPDDRFDVAVMALVIFFVPDPAESVREMIRVVRPGGLVGSYVWDVFGGGFPLEPIQAEIREMGIAHPLPPSSGITGTEALTGLWNEAGLEDIKTTVIAVERTFDDFDDFWTTTLISSVASVVAGMDADDVDRLKARVRTRLSPDAAGRVTYGAHANAIVGRVPG